jgi:hypothetical protein
MITYSEAELAGLTPDEQEALRADADSAAGADAGEEASSEAAAAADASTATVAAEDAATVAASAEADAAADAGGEPAADKPDGTELKAAESAEFTPKFTADMPEGAADRLLEIQTEKDSLVERFNDGEIDMPALMAGMSRLDDERVTLVVAQENAKFAEHQNASLRTQRWEWEQERFFGNDKNAATYADPVMVAALDSQVKILANDKANASRKASWFLEEADRLVRARFTGAATPATPATPTPAAAGREPQPTVRTLAGLPAAAPAPVGDDVMGKISLLEGEDLEKFMAKMPTADVDKLLRAAA